MHVVAFVVVCGTGAATAAAVIELALAAGTGIGLGAELLEHLGIGPNFVERRVVHIARLFHHVGAGAHLPDRAHDAVADTGKAATAVARLDVELVCNAQELRCASGFDGDSERAALFHNLAEESFVFGDAERMAFDFLAAADRNEEENLVVHRTDFLDPVHDVENLVLVPVHNRRVNLERETSRLAVFDAHHRHLEGIRKAAEVVMAVVVDTVDADAHRHGSRLLEFKGKVVRNERAVGAEHRAKSLARGVCHQFHNIRAGHGLAAAKNHDLEPRLRDFINQFQRLRRREFGSLVFARVLVAVLAGQVTLVGGHPRYYHLKTSLSPDYRIAYGSSQWSLNIEITGP